MNIPQRLWARVRKRKGVQGYRRCRWPSLGEVYLNLPELRGSSYLCMVAMVPCFRAPSRVFIEESGTEPTGRGTL